MGREMKDATLREEISEKKNEYDGETDRQMIESLLKDRRKRRRDRKSRERKDARLRQETDDKFRMTERQTDGGELIEPYRKKAR